MQAVLTVFDNLKHIMAEEQASGIAAAIGTTPERLMFARYRHTTGQLTESFLEGTTMALTYSIVLSTLKLVRDVPDVVPVDDLVKTGMDLVDMNRLAANHSGIPLPDGHQPTPSTERYKDGVFAVDGLLADAQGVYTPDLLIFLAGKLNVAWQSPFNEAGANVRYMKTRIEDAAVAGGGTA